MSNEERIAEIKQKVKKLGLSYVVSIAKNRNLVEFVKKQTSFLDNESYIYPTSERLWFILNDVYELPKCKNCNKPLNNPKSFLSINAGFREYCCLRCATSSKTRTQHIQATTMKKFGHACIFSAPEMKAQIMKTNSCKSDEEKALRIARARATRAMANGGKWHNESFIEKCKATSLKKNDIENWRNHEKAAETLQERYGTSCALDIADARGKAALALKKRSYEMMLSSELDEPTFSFEAYASNRDPHEKLKFKCKRCGKIFKTIHLNGIHQKCPNCFPKTEGTSNEERSLKEFIESLIAGKHELEVNSRKVIAPLELDLYVPSKKLAIEFDGLYWHSDAEQLDKNYHLKKTLLCEEKGIQLVHVFENEWLAKKDIVKSRLKNLLGVYDKVIYARKCQVREVGAKTSREFQERTHIQGSVAAKVNIGLFFDDRLVSLMTFGKPRFNKHHDWELLRFSPELNCHVIGGASKLLNFFEKKYSPKSLISYADRRWSQGKLYRALGFNLNFVSGPNYWYFKDNLCYLHSRVAFQKHKLKSLLEHFDPSKTEVQNMHENGYHRIFDCGNLVFIKTCKD